MPLAFDYATACFRYKLHNPSSDSAYIITDCVPINTLCEFLMMPPKILLSRENSSMASTWTELLCVEREQDEWKIGEYAYQWAGSIYDLIPEDKRYDEDDELVIPEFWEGVRVRGVADGEYIETEEIVVRGELFSFSKDQIEDAIAFVKAYGWDRLPDFEQAMGKLVTIVSGTSTEASTGAAAPEASA